MLLLLQRIGNIWQKPVPCFTPSSSLKLTALLNSLNKCESRHCLSVGWIQKMDPYLTPAAIFCRIAVLRDNSISTGVKRKHHRASWLLIASVRSNLARPYGSCGAETTVRSPVRGSRQTTLDACLVVGLHRGLRRGRRRKRVPRAVHSCPSVHPDDRPRGMRILEI